VAATGVDLEAHLGPLRLPNPLVAASGTFGHGTELARLCPPDRLGAVTTKSLAAFPWPGNPPPRLHPAAGGGMLNSVGLAGPGVAAWLADGLPALVAAGARIVVSIWGRSREEFAEVAAALCPAADRLVAVEVNVSCPNLEDRSRMFAHSATATAAVTRTVLEAGPGLPVFVKLSPNTAELVEIAGAALAAGATGLTLTNTLLAAAIDPVTRRPVLGAGTGGLSGPPLHPVAVRAVLECASAHPGVPIIGTGGVRTGRDAVEMLLAGAAAVGVGTATFAEPRAMLRILSELERFCVRHGVRRVRDLVGAAR
jgi:dihydroorotate dehydrogenase (NAD+) catalytic subunit